MTRLDGKLTPALLVRDLEASLAFYGRLGFEASGRWPEQGVATWAEVRRDGVVLQLYTDAPVGTPGEPCLSGTLYMYVDDVGALAAELSGEVELHWGPEEMEYGQKELGLRDPDGYFLAFAER